MRTEAHSNSPSVSRDATQRSRRISAGFREKTREGLAKALYYSGALRAVRRIERNHELRRSSTDASLQFSRSPASKFGILCYHRVGVSGVPFHSRLEPALFEDQMRYIKRNYRIVPLGQLCHELKNSEKVPPTLAVTFDDGYRDLFDFAFPILRKYAIPATIYLIGRSMETGEAPWYDRIFAGFVAHSSDTLELQLDTLRRFSLSTVRSRHAAAWEAVCYLRSIADSDRLLWCAEFDRRMQPPVEVLRDRILDWAQVRVMHKAGVFFGAHTMSHPAVSQLDSRALQIELIDSKRLLEKGLGEAIADFAYPFGKMMDGSAAAQEMLVKGDYRSAVTTIEGFNSPGQNPYRLRRLQIGDDCPLPIFAFNLSRLFLEATAQDPFVCSSLISPAAQVLQESVPGVP